MSQAKVSETIETTEKKTKNSIPTGLDVKLAFLHQAVQIPGVMGNERTVSEAKIPGIVMTWTTHGLIINAKGTTAIIPQANVAVAVFSGK